MPSDTENGESDNIQHKTKLKRSGSPSRDDPACRLQSHSKRDSTSEESPSSNTKNRSPTSPSPKRYRPSDMLRDGGVVQNDTDNSESEISAMPANYPADVHQRSSSDLPGKRDRLSESSNDVDVLTKIPRIHEDSESQRRQNVNGSVSLACLASKIKEVLKTVKTQNKDIVAFLGGTGVGKTTTVDFCCGAKIFQVSASEDEYADLVLDVDPEETEKFLKIGHRGSKTKTIDFLPSPSKDKGQNLLFCDMPGSGDTNAIDKIVNCVLRSQALMCAKTVRPILVIKQKDFKAGRCKISKSDIEFTASCFKDAKYFTQILILVTHAEEIDDERTVGKLRSYLREIPSEEPWVEPLAADFHRYLIEQCDKAVNDLKKKRDNSSNLQVVRPLHPESREALLDFIGGSWAIDSPEEALRFNLEKDAEKVVNTLVSEESEKIGKWLDVSYEFEKVATVLLDMNAVLKAIGKNNLFRRAKDRVIVQNASLFNSIKLILKSFLCSPMEGVDLTDLNELVKRFQDMQVISTHVGHLLADRWKSVEMLMWDCNEDLKQYIHLENGKGSWEAQEGCVRRVKSLGLILDCKEAEQRASTNVLNAIEACSDAVHLFQDPVSVADALISLRLASSFLTGELQEAADKTLVDLLTFLFGKLDDLVQDIGQKCKEIECSNGELVGRKKIELQNDVTKLYKFTRPDQRIDEFLPADARSDAEAGFYKKFITELKLDAFCSVEINRQQLLQHFNILSCLIQVEDDELHCKLNTHMDALKAQIERFLETDFKHLDEIMNMVFSREVCPCSESAKFHELVNKFNSLLQDAGQLMQFDSINREKICSAQFIKFFELYLNKVSNFQIKAKRGLLSVAVVEQSVPIFFICQDCSLPESILSQTKCTCLKQLIGNVQSLHTECKSTIESEAVEQCKQIESDAQRNNYNFDTTAGLIAFDESLVKLDLFLQISAKDSSGQNAKCLLQQQFTIFLQAQKLMFKEQAELPVADLDIGCLITSFNNLMPYAKADGLKKVVMDKNLLQELARAMKRIESELVAHAEGELDHGEATRLYQKISRVIRWKNFEGFELSGSQACCLKDAQDRVRLIIDKNIKDIKTVLDDTRYDEVAKFLDQCSKAEKDRILNEATSTLKSEIKIVRRYVHQISWLDTEKIEDLGKGFERILECSSSGLFAVLSEPMQTELTDAVELVRSEVKRQSHKFKDVLEKIIAKKASYNDCEKALQVLVGLRQYLPEHFQFAEEQFENHKLMIRDNFDLIEKSDDEGLQQVANDVIDTMYELNVHAEANEQTWKVFHSSWHSVRRQLEPQLSKIVQKLKGRANVLLAQKDVELAIQLLDTHDKVRDYALKAGFSPVQISEATEQRRSILDMQSANIDMFKSSLRRGNYDAAANAISELTNEMLLHAKSALEDRIAELTKDVERALHEPAEQSKLGKSLEHLGSINSAFQNSKPVQSLISNLEDSLKEIFDNCDSMMGLVSAELHKLSMKDISQPLDGWSIELEKVRKILNFPSSFIAPQLDNITQHLHYFANRMHSFIMQQMDDVNSDAESLQLHSLHKICNTLEMGINVLQAMEHIAAHAGRPFGFRLSSLAAESRETLLQALISKSKEAVDLVNGGIPDKNALSKLLATLNQAATATDERYRHPFREATTKICTIFDQKVETARDSWSHKEDGWSDQMNAILRFIHHGQGAFQETLVLHQMATDCMNQVLKVMKDDIDIKEQEMYSTITRNSGEVARKLLEVRGISGNVDLMHKYTTDAVKRILSRLQDSFSEDKSMMTKLGSSLNTSEVQIINWENQSSQKILMCFNA